MRRGKSQGKTHGGAFLKGVARSPRCFTRLAVGPTFGNRTLAG